MSDINDITETTKTVWESFKKIFYLLKERKLFAALKESFGFLRLIYVNHLKGKYITVKGKKIPRTLVAIVALFLIYSAFPSCQQAPSGSQDIAEAANVKKDSNTYDENGLRVYELRKCETEESSGACGLLEDYGENNFSRVTITLAFYSGDGRIVYEGGVEASDVEAHTRSKINIPCPEEFAYFKLKSVNPEGMTPSE